MSCIFRCYYSTILNTSFQILVTDMFLKSKCDLQRIHFKNYITYEATTAIGQALQEHDGKNWETEEELLPSGHQAPKLIIITSTGLNLINCKNIHYSPSSTLLLCVHTRYNLFAYSSCTSLVILIFIKSTIDCIAHFISLHILLFFFFFFSYLILTYIYIYSPVLCIISFILSFCTVHWADLSWPTFHYWLYPVWLCMWQIIKNLEPT